MENKTSKYFKYAIGEIVLVVIGILIALQINNWNQNRLEKIKSKEFHQRIIQDLDLMIVNMNGMIDKSTRVKTHIISSLNILRNNVFNKEQKDTLDYALKNYYQFLRLDESIKSIEEMKSSGQFGLIQVKELKKAIDDYLIILSNISKIFDQIAIDVNNDAIIEKHLFIEVKGTKLDSNVFYDFNAIKKDQAFINRLSKISMSWQTKLVFSKLLLKRSKELKEKIELELNK